MQDATTTVHPARQFSVSFRAAMLLSFSPRGYVLFGNERGSEQSRERGNCDLVFPEKKYLFRFIGRLPGLQRLPYLQASHKRFPRTLGANSFPSTKRSRGREPPAVPLSLPWRKVSPEATSSIVALILPGQPSDYSLKRNLHTNFTAVCTALCFIHRASELLHFKTHSRWSSPANFQESMSCEILRTYCRIGNNEKIDRLQFHI